MGGSAALDDRRGQVGRSEGFHGGRQEGGGRGLRTVTTLDAKRWEAVQKNLSAIGARTDAVNGPLSGEAR